MESVKTFENYPVGTVILSNIVSLTIYGLGLVIMHLLGWLISVLYLLYIAAFEYRLIRYHCTKCFYFGKTCGFGKGRLSAIFFKKGDPAKFCSKAMSWKDMIPDLLISLIPLVTGIVLLIMKFNIILLSALFMLILLTTSGNGFIRGKKTCNYCKQRELGCPADKLFNKA